MIPRLIAAIGVLSLVATSGKAQDPAAQIKAEVKDVKFESQPTPQIQATNVVDKRWKPKTWLEVDTEFEIKLPRAEGGNEGTYPALDVRYFLVTSARSKEGKPVLLTGGVTYSNIPAHEKCHALAFVSPATLKRALMKDNGGKADIIGWAVEVTASGQVIAGKAGGAGAAASKWWEDVSKFTVIDTSVLGKDKTPFAPFWGDYDVTPQSK